MNSGPYAEEILTTDDLDEAAETPLSAQKLQPRVDHEDAFPSLILDDGERTVEISTAIGPRREAAERLVRLASTALALAMELKDQK